MAPAPNPKQGKKRTRNGTEKPQQQSKTPPTSTLAPSEKPQTGSNTPPNTLTTHPTPQTHSSPNRPAGQQSQMPPPPRPNPPHPPSLSTAPKQDQQQSKSKIQKVPRLPPQTTKITTRPLPHPPIPSPFSASTSPKTIYITTTSPFIPAIKRIRGLLAEIKKREDQSTAATLSGRARNIYGRKSRSKTGTRRAGAGARGARGGGVPGVSGTGRPVMNLVPDGTLTERDVEAAIADSAASLASGGGTSMRKGRECVYIKATGRAIPRALEIGVYFQAQSDCGVRVEMGSVKAVDDIEVLPPEQDEGEGEEKEVRDEEGDVDMRDVGGEESTGREGKRLQEDLQKGEKEKRKKVTGKKASMPREDIPETRIRTLSAITVSVWSV
ncbi:uncharacterized protein EI97DRAFT_501683 [Westerdykella ornata]|uniref:Uncharacterized protein n=1 Tax=Westerdykella ornata TaxID=318751 RepID=A0A6A6JJT0_WESOR|nr:uncharacterized protein EI97DRAFT_501683 [Westerdykella ornata]KAF2275946.1 hypothetical protein EI97DRAFT_501683 [Westerdykella ornata]